MAHGLGEMLIGWLAWVGRDHMASRAHAEQVLADEDALRLRILAELGWGFGYGPQQHQWERFTANLVAE